MIKRGSTVAVGLSGGVDSVCLLHYLKNQSGEVGFDVVAVNVEHGIRGQDSLSDTAFCRKFCQKLGVTLKEYSVNAPAFSKEQGYSLEQAARQLRYNCFFDAIDSGFCDVVAVAHHLSDNAETILFNVLRGTSLSGAKGILPVSYGERIIRPFLGVKKEDILSYAKENELPFVTDRTNFDISYTRNAIREVVLPSIKRIFPEYEGALSRFAQVCQSDDEYLYSLAEKSVHFEDGCAKIACDTPYPVFSRAVISALKRAGVEKDYQKSHVDAVFALKNLQTGKKVDLIKNVYAIKVHDHIEIKIKSAVNRPIAPFSLGETKLGGYTIRVEKAQNITNADMKSGQYFDLGKLPENLFFRKKQDGDVFIKFNGQKVTLKKFLTDKKIPADEKKELLVLADEKTVYLIAGLEISCLIKIDKTTKNIVKLTCTKDRSL